MKLGVFGGSFDPPHYAHLKLAIAAREQLELDRVFWMLTGQSPFKQQLSLTDPEVRFRMIEVLISHHSEMILSRLEIDRPGPHYMVDTLALLKEKYPTDDLFYLMGSDLLMDFSDWKEPETILGLCRILVWKRPGLDLDQMELGFRFPGLLEKLNWLETAPSEISGTEIRRRIQTGESQQDWLPPETEELIRQEGLYAAGS